MQTFCDRHILAFLKNWNHATPLDLALGNYFRAHKSLGSHDRKKVGDAVYTLVRWQSLFDYLDPSESYSLRLHMLNQAPIETWTEDAPDYAKYGLSEFLYEKIKSTYGDIAPIAAVMNSPAPIAIRANLLKTTREALINALSPKFSVRPSENAPAGIVFSKREPLFALPEFKQGLFEMQDEGSQIVAELVEAKAGDRVLDFCSGSGGKALAIAPKMQGKGELYLHDIREQSLKEAVLRLRRAGVQNAQILNPTHPTLKKLFGKMDWVLADVPCSGSGTLRRNCDMKWKIDGSLIDRLVREQRAIFEQALKFAKSDGKIVYVTCSIFKDENEEQVEFFLKNFDVILDKEPLKLLPVAGGSDGFFGAVFKKSQKR